MLDIGHINDPQVIARNSKVTVINSAIETHMIGPVCADSICSRIHSGVGGQMDLTRRAALSQNGKQVTAFPSVTRQGESRIVTLLKQGAGVVTTMAHVHCVVTEYEIANCMVSLFARDPGRSSISPTRTIGNASIGKLTKYFALCRGWAYDTVNPTRKI